MAIKFYFLSNIFVLVFIPFCFAQYQPYNKNSSSWDYSMGGGKKFEQPYTSLRQIERNVYTYPLPQQQESTLTQSPLGQDYYTYILPQKIINIKLVEMEFLPQQAVEERAERLAKEIEEAMPIIMKAAIEKMKKTGEESQSYLIRVKPAHVEEKEEESQTEKAATAEEETKEEGLPKENEIDVLVRVLFGGEKVVIKLPPLKDPKEKERLIKELERIANILVRHEELFMEIQEQAE